MVFSGSKARLVWVNGYFLGQFQEVIKFHHDVATEAMMVIGLGSLSQGLTLQVSELVSFTQTGGNWSLIW